MADSPAAKNSSPTPIGLGTFAGVFTPSILTILGIILFLRLGYVIGQAGLGRGLIIIALANTISVLTSISLAAVATNLNVKAGGDYYLISRTLGVEFGGAIGIVLFLAQSISVAFYCLGFGEVVTAIAGLTHPQATQLVAAGAVGLLFILAWLGADWATKFQFVVMAILAAALVSFFVGGLPGWDTARLGLNWSAGENSPGFWIIFAIFFPAVTGFTQGVSMSGDLREPGVSLPRGTFIAVGLSMVVYFGVALVMAANLPLSVLGSDYRAMNRIAWFSPLIDAGVVAATLSSAMASFLGAPRILQSMSIDRVFPFLKPFAVGHGPTNNPRRGVLLTLALAGVTILLGRLNVIAPVVTMFFLVSYGLLNYATYYEAGTASPSFRPRFRFYNRRFSLVGWLACLGAMLAIDPAAGVAAAAILAAIHQYLKRTAGPSRWADSRRSYHLQRVRENLLGAAREPVHPRDWRPQILAFSDKPERRTCLLRLASWLEGGSGLTTAVRLIEAGGAKMIKERAEAEEELSRDEAIQEFSAFPLVLASPDLKTAIGDLVQAYGLGPIKANTILLNWPDSAGQEGVFGLRHLRYGRSLRAAFRLGVNLVVFNARPPLNGPLEPDWRARRIDVWWRDDNTGQLMILLAYLMTRSEAFGQAELRLLVEGDPVDPQAGERVAQLLSAARIGAKIELVADLTADKMAELSAGADLALLPFRLRGGRLLDRFGQPAGDLLPRLPSAALVLAAQDIDLDAEPEEGTAGELAAARDALTDALAKLRAAQTETAKAGQAVEDRLADLDQADPENAEAARANLDQAKDEAIGAARKTAVCRAKAYNAMKTLEDLGETPPDEAREEINLNRD